MVNSTSDHHHDKAGESPPLSSPSTIKERTLSYYFHLHHDDVSTPRAPHSHHPLKSTSTDSARARHNPTNKHASSSHHHHPGQWKPLLDVADGHSPLSWLSTLFSGRKRKQTVGSRHACDEGKGETFSATSLDWEAPRASAWEQLSAWEKHSWDLPTAGHQRASDAEKENDPTIALQAEAELETPMKKTQESSRQGQVAWMKNLLAMKWAMKLRRRVTKKRAAEHGRGDGENDDERGSSTMSAAASSARGSDYSQISIYSGQIKAGEDRIFHSQRELGETWSSHYIPLLQSSTNANSSLKPIKTRPAHVTREESGLLRFYLTPTRGIKFGTKRQRSHHPLIPLLLEV